MNEMTDDMAIFGPHRAVICEWTTPDACSKLVIKGKTYCPEHFRAAYQPAKKKKKANGR